MFHPFAEQPWGRATARATAWLIRVLSVSANDYQILNGLARMLCCSGIGELWGLSLHPPPPTSQRSQLACSQPKGEMLLCGCGDLTNSFCASCSLAQGHILYWGGD